MRGTPIAAGELFITRHAVERFQERVAQVTPKTARRALRKACDGQTRKAADTVHTDYNGIPLIVKVSADQAVVTCWRC